MGNFDHQRVIPTIVVDITRLDKAKYLFKKTILTSTFEAHIFTDIFYKCVVNIVYQKK